MTSAERVESWALPAKGVALLRQATERHWSRSAVAFGEGPAEHSRNGPYKLRTGAELMIAPPQAWRIKGVLPEAGIAAIYGPPSSGKSFLVLDMACALALGSAWFGHKVKPCSVTYACLEGAAGLPVRLKALSKPISENLLFITAPVNILDPKDVAGLVASVQARGATGGVIIIDTLNRATPGADENSSADMGRAIAATGAMQRALGGLVLLISHTGKDASKGIRGHSSLLAALDAAIEVQRDQDTRSWSLIKAKDGADGLARFFDLEVVNLGADSDGDAISSCRIRYLERTASKRPVSVAQKLGMESFMAAGAANGGAGAVQATVDQWRAEFFRRSTAETIDGKRSLFSRVRRELVEMGKLTVSNDVYKLPTSSVDLFNAPSRESD